MKARVEGREVRDLRLIVSRVDSFNTSTKHEQTFSRFDGGEAKEFGRKLTGERFSVFLSDVDLAHLNRIECSLTDSNARLRRTRESVQVREVENS